MNGISDLPANKILVEMDFPPADYERKGRLWVGFEDDILRLRWDEGAPASQIGLELGRPKNSVIGRARRLKLAYRQTGFLFGNQAHKQRPNPRIKPTVQGFPIIKRPKVIDIIPEGIMEMATNGKVHGTPLLELRGNPEVLDGTAQCRWPINSPRRGETYEFCTATQIPNSSYCRHHAERSVSPYARRI